jgi:hypothetical protein
VGDDAGNEVEGEDALGSLFLAVDGEGDPLVEELDVGVATALMCVEIRFVPCPFGRRRVSRGCGPRVV